MTITIIVFWIGVFVGVTTTSLHGILRGPCRRIIIMLIAAWSEFEWAEVHTRALREDMRTWLRPEPGSSFLQQASRTRERIYRGAAPGAVSGHST